MYTIVCEQRRRVIPRTPVLHKCQEDPQLLSLLSLLNDRVVTGLQVQDSKATRAYQNVSLMSGDGG